MERIVVDDRLASRCTKRFRGLAELSLNVEVGVVGLFIQPSFADPLTPEVNQVCPLDRGSAGSEWVPITVFFSHPIIESDCQFVTTTTTTNKLVLVDPHVGDPVEHGGDRGFSDTDAWCAGRFD